MNALTQYDKYASMFGHVLMNGLKRSKCLNIRRTVCRYRMDGLTQTQIHSHMITRIRVVFGKLEIIGRNLELLLNANLQNILVIIVVSNQVDPVYVLFKYVFNEYLRHLKSRPRDKCIRKPSVLILHINLVKIQK